ncbi:hypothetical protein HOF56_04935 [Candidatus Peribacteria bacterium]|jgi:hypothetical protein|nr:hypothetical protein [Candidatus Peribacteria bacterium]MBT4021465.1 hypothetical protein [Candidatus Peribacteria bacterium]MBT4240375.1 hypothetical protein [Candidatus Peribacteria bacterium]MBT4473798.1 hypothetical protein [Candidatus Peribacteria bacterium]
MKNWISIAVVIFLSAVALSIIEDFSENGNSNTNEVESSKVVVVKIDDSIGGCGYIFEEYEIPVVSNRLKSVFSALPNFEPRDGYENPVGEQDIEIAVKEEKRGFFVVNIIGDLKLGGLCDSDAFREQMERTVEIYSGDYEMQLNGSSDEYECMRLITGGCS